MRLRLVMAFLYTSVGFTNAADLQDDFNAGKLDALKWTSKQILPHQQSFIKPGRCGDAAISVTVFNGDSGETCDEDCQRAEIRTSEKYWPKYGNEVWFAFSFRIVGTVPNTGSHRTVIGQWKGPGDESPMIAQRFDNNVFHITVQDNETRRVIAKADGDIASFVKAQELLGKLDPENERTVNSIRLLQSLDQAIEFQPSVGDKLLSQDFSMALQGADELQGRENLANALDLADADLISQFSAMAFVAEPEKYIGKAEIAILPEKNKSLPDPRAAWVDMVYRIKPGRTDNEIGPIGLGEVEVWANGEKIVSVKGNIGATQKKIDKPNLVGPYFKFGTYRVRVPEKFSFDFDEFSQASSRTGLASVCAAASK